MLVLQVVQPSMVTGGELRSYQLGGVKFLLSLYNNGVNGILADEMGLGKTIQTIAFLAWLLERKHAPGPHLILAPKVCITCMCRCDACDLVPTWAIGAKSTPTWACERTPISSCLHGRRFASLRTNVNGNGGCSPAVMPRADSAGL